MFFLENVCCQEFFSTKFVVKFFPPEQLRSLDFFVPKVCFRFFAVTVQKCNIKLSPHCAVTFFFSELRRLVLRRSLL